jgi:hypothetical protein
MARLDRLDAADHARPVRLLGVRVDLVDVEVPEPPTQ